MQPYNLSANLYQGYLFSHPALNSMQYYAVPAPPPVFPSPFSHPNHSQTIFLLPQPFPTTPSFSGFAPQSTLQSATLANPQQAATAPGKRSEATRAPPVAAKSKPNAKAHARKLPEASAAPIVKNNALPHLAKCQKSPPAQEDPSKVLPKPLVAPPPSPPLLKPVSGLKSNFSSSTSVRKEPRQKFKGETEVRKKGRREVIIYRIPGTSTLYSFKVLATRNNIKHCYCRGCWEYYKYTGVKVVGTDFLSDPCKLDHICFPIRREEKIIGGISDKKIQGSCVPVKEKKETITEMSIRAIERLSMSEEFKKELIERTLRADEKRKQQRREYRQRKKAEKETTSRLLEYSYIELADNSSGAATQLEEMALEENDEEKQLTPMEVLDVMSRAAVDDANCIYIE